MTTPPDPKDQARRRLQRAAEQVRQASAEQDQALIEATRVGMFHREIAAILGHPREWVSRRLRALNKARGQSVEPPASDTEGDDQPLS